MSILSRIANLFRDDHLSSDIEREQSFHLRERVEELTERGIPEDEAIAMARRQFGNRTFQGEDTREANIVTWLDSLRGDARYAFRALRRSPVFTSVAVASLALGIGANTAIYSLIDAVLLRPLPVPHPEQLLQVTTSEGGDGYFTNPMWEEVRNRQQVFPALAAFSETSVNAADGGEVRRLRGLWASGDYFRVFHMEPAVGRLFTRTDDVRGCAGTAVLGNGFWQSEYGGRSDVVGRTISIAGKPLEIIGVASQGFSGPEVGRDVQLYMPLCAEAIVNAPRSALDRRSNWWLRVIGRFDQTLTVDQVRARLKTIAPDVYAATVPEGWAAEHKAGYLKRTLSVAPAAMGMSSVRERYARALKILMGAVGLVLLIACANVANLLLARATARQREVAIRLAIGAARRRLVRQLLTESAILALLGAAGGLVVGYWGTQGLVALISTPSDPVVLDLGLNLRVLGFTVLIATVTAMIFGLVPAWRGTRVDPQAAMKANARGVVEGGGAGGRFTIGKALVVAQVALSLTLLVGAGLLIGSLRKLTTMDPGFTAEGVLVARANFTRTGIPNAQMPELRARLLQRLRSTPGVRAASASDLTPISGSSWNDKVYVDGYVHESENDFAWFNEITDGYFATLDTRLLAGRDFDATDRPGGQRVAIVNESAAKRYFGNASPLGKTFRTKRGDTFSEPVTIVGVVEDAKYRSLRETDSFTFYIPAMQSTEPAPGFTLELRSSGDARSLVPVVKNAVAEVHDRASIEFTLLSDQVEGSLRRDRMLAVLSGLFGAVALALSVLGLYGVMAYTVARRRNEIGVRIAMGADGTRVMRMVLGDVTRVVGIGIVLGVAGALASGKLVKAFLYGLEPSDPVVFGAAAGLLLLVALAAGLVPAMRASRVDPVAALRED